MNLRIYQLLGTVINTGLSVITFFLVLRVVLRFFSANSATPFVSWILSVSNFLMIPFVNIIPNVISQTGVLDIVAIITLLAYLVAGFLLLNILQSMTGTEAMEEEYTTISHYHDIPSRKKHK